MANRNFNHQTTNPHKAPKSQGRKGKPVTDGKPDFKQVMADPLKTPMKDQGFKSKSQMVDVLS